MQRKAKNLCFEHFKFQVMVTMKQPNSNEEKFIRILEKGDFFGEKALQGYVIFLI